MEFPPKNHRRMVTHSIQGNSSIQNAFSGWVAILLPCQHVSFFHLFVLFFIVLCKTIYCTSQRTYLSILWFSRSWFSILFIIVRYLYKYLASVNSYHLPLLDCSGLAAPCQLRSEWLTHWLLDRWWDGVPHIPLPLSFCPTLSKDTLASFFRGIASETWS
jgi:hypothetical protein